MTSMRSLARLMAIPKKLVAYAALEELKMKSNVKKWELDMKLEWNWI